MTEAPEGASTHRYRGHSGKLSRLSGCSPFEDHAHHRDEVEFWFARELRELLGYTKWENFEQVIAKAKIVCRSSGYDHQDHFPEVGKMIDLGKGGQREINDAALTRHACYLIAQNGNPRKDEIAFAMRSTHQACKLHGR